MKPIRLALFIALAIYHLIVVGLALRFTQSLADSIVRSPLAFRFLAFFGLVLFAITFALAWFDRRASRKRIEKLEAEKNAIKAEVFDMRKREQEVEQEIASFKSSLPPEKPAPHRPNPLEPRSADTDFGPAQPDSTAPDLIDSRSTESNPTESNPTESNLTEPDLAGPHPAGPHLAGPHSDEEAEYGPLEPRPDSPLWDTDEPTDPEQGNTDEPRRP